MNTRRRIAKAVMEHCGSISEESAALAKLYRSVNKAVKALKEAKLVMYSPSNAIPIVKLVGSPEDMDRLIAELEEVSEQ